MGESFQANSDLSQTECINAAGTGSPSLNQRASFINRPDNLKVSGNNCMGGDFSRSLQTLQSLTIAAPCTDDQENIEKPGVSRQPPSLAPAGTDTDDQSSLAFKCYRGFDLSAFEMLSTVGK